MRKRFFAALLSFIMIFSLLPVNVLAAADSTSVMSIEPPDAEKFATYEFYATTTDETAWYTQTVKAGDTLNQPTAPTRAGYYFTSWQTEDGGAVPFGVIDTVTETATIKCYARWGQNSNPTHVYFMAAPLGTTGADEVVYTGVAANGKLDIPAEYSYVTWLTKDNAVFDGKNVTADIDVYPQASACWLTFNSQGGSTVASRYVQQNKEFALSEVGTPTKTGYTFAGWSLTEDGMVTDTVTPTGDTTLYAIWTPATANYTVIHWWENANDDEYSYHESEVKSGTTGQQTKAAAKTYIITDMGLNGQKATRRDVFTAAAIEQKTINGDGSTIVNVFYTRNQYTLSFGSYEGWQQEWTESSRITKKYGQDILPAEWPKNGRQANWGIDDTNRYIAFLSTMPLGGGKLIAQSDTGKVNTATYYVETLNGKESGATQESNRWFIVHHADKTMGTAGNTVGNEDRYAITGFTLIEDMGTQVGNKYKNAKFYYSRDSYDVVYFSNGAKAHTDSYKYEQNISAAGSYTPANAPAGYQFDGWCSDPAGTTPFDFAGKTMPAQNVTVYAKWIPVTLSLKIEGVGNDLSSSVSYNQRINETEVYKNAMAQLGGAAILYWENAETGEKVDVNSQMTTNLVIRPVLKGETYQLTYANADNTDAHLYWYNTTAKVQEYSGENTNKFLYWTDAAGKEYHPGDEIKMIANVELTANFNGENPQPSKYGVNYHSNFDTDSVYTDSGIENYATFATLTYAATKLPDRAGYTFASWNTKADGTGASFTANATARIDGADSNDLYAQWTANTDTEYTVEFYYQNDDGSGYTKNKTDVRHGTTDTTVEVTAEDKAQTQNGKYVFDAANQSNVLSGNIAGDSSLVLKLYFKLNQAECIIHHYLLGTAVKVAEDEESSVQIGQTLTAKPAESFILGYEKAQFNSYAPKQSITVSTTNKEIIVYYTMPLVIKAEDAEKKYDGTPLTCSDFTVEGLVNNDGASIVTLKMTDDSTITNAGTQANKIDKSSVKISKFYYTFTCEDGELKITPSNAAVVVTIKGNIKDDAIYNGKTQSVRGYTVDYGGLNSASFTVEYKGEGTEPTASGKNVDTYYMGLTDSSFTVTSTNYSNVTVKVEDGYLKINPVSDEVVITINGKIDDTAYNGTEQTVTGYTVDYGKRNPDDFNISYTGEATASGKDAGTYYMDLIKDNFIVTSGNYSNIKVVVNDGRLTIGKRTVTLVSDDLSKEYDGSPLVNGDTPLKTEDGWVNGEGATYTFTGSRTYPGTTKNGNTFEVNYNANTDEKNYEVKKTFGDLTVTNRNAKYEINLTGRSAIYSYNGGEQSIDGFEALTFEIAGHTYTVTGASHEAKGTHVSSSPYQGVISGTAVVRDANDKDVTAQFTVNLTPGTLTITPAQLTITAGSDSKLYDGTALTFGDYQNSDLQGNDYIESVSIVGSQTEPGSSQNVASNAVIKNAAGENATSDYTITYKPGTLTVTTISKALQVEATDEEKKYDGDPLTGSYTYTEGVLLEGDELVVELEGSLTNAGECGNVIKSCKVMRGDVDVTKLYAGLTTQNGTLTITPRQINLSSGSKTWEYDGAEHSLPDVTMTGDDFVEGQGFAKCIATGTITNVGSVENSIKYSLAEGTLAQNYSIQTEPGTLEVVKRGSVTEAYKVIITANDNRVYYDGREHGENGYTVTDNLLKEYGHTLASVSIPFKAKDVGVYTGKLEPQNAVICDAQGNDVTANYLIEYRNGTLEIVKRHYPSTPSVTKPALNTADHYAYVMGYPDGTVQPGGYITRAEASTIFFRLLTDETREQYWATTNAYSDVKSGDWYNNAISTLSNAGIVSGYPDGTFRPNAPITRAEMSKIIALFAKLDKTTDRFSDIAGHWAEAYIKLAAGNGWIEGYPDGTFKPQQNITRAETVTMINRVLERVPSEESHLLPYASMLTFPDCQPGQWFYIAIQEATNSHTYERAVTEKNGDEQWTALRENRDWTLLEK